MAEWYFIMYTDHSGFIQDWFNILATVSWTAETGKDFPFLCFIWLFSLIRFISCRDFMSGYIYPKVFKFLWLLWIKLIIQVLSHSKHCLCIQTVKCSGFQRYRIIPSENRDSITSFSPICLHWLFCLIALAKISKTMLNSKGENGYSYFVSDLSRNGSSFPFSKMLAVDLPYIVLIVLRYFLVIPSLFRVLSWKCVVFTQWFLCMY